MLSKLLGRSRVAAAARPMAPEGIRIYAIGDVHGCDRELAALLATIDADDAARGSARTIIVFLGDLIDRGPDSAAVVERVHRRMAARPDTRLIAGNHEEVLLLGLNGSLQAMRLFLQIGGRETLLSYGLSEADCDEGSMRELIDTARARIPADHVALMARGEAVIVLGDYAFVHAGIKPRVPLERQALSDLRWIRDGFLDDATRHDKYIVHGHTITEEVDVRANRMGVDTGAFRSGRLSAAAFEGGDFWTLEAGAGAARTYPAA